MFLQRLLLQARVERGAVCWTGAVRVPAPAIQALSRAKSLASDTWIVGLSVSHFCTQGTGQHAAQDQHA